MFLVALISAMLALPLYTGEEPEKQVPAVGISTNIPYDITWVPGYGVTSIPSVSMEFYPTQWRRVTLGADVEFPMWKNWDTHRFMQINNLTFWARRYFFAHARESADRFRGPYLFANVNAARYSIGFDMHGWQGEGVGASLGFGYKWLLGKRLFIDTGLALGYFYSRYDPFVFGNDGTGWYYYDFQGDPVNFVPRRMELHWMFYPTRVYISVGLDFFRRKK